MEESACESPGFAAPPLVGGSSDFNTTGPLLWSRDDAFDPTPLASSAVQGKDVDRVSEGGPRRLLTGANRTSPLFRKFEAVIASSNLDSGVPDTSSALHGATIVVAKPCAAEQTPPATPLPPPPPPPQKPQEFSFEKITAACIDAMKPFGSTRYNLLRGSLLRRNAVPIERVLTWKPRCISTSLTLLPPDLDFEAVCCFKSVLAFMGDRSSGTSPSEHAGVLAAKAMHYPPALLDELYCQICKQTTGNPNPVSCVGGWQLMLVLLAVTVPGAALTPCMLEFARQTSEMSPQACQSKSYAAAAVVALQKTSQMEPRKHYLSHEELRSIITLHGVKLLVFLVNSSSVELRVDSWTTVADTADIVATRLGLGDASRFRLFEEAGKGGGSSGGRIGNDDSSAKKSEQSMAAPLPAERRILDVTARWSRVQDSAEEPRLVYKAHLLLESSPGDPTLTEMMYLQAVYEITSGAIPTPTLPECVRLAALQLQQEIGDELEKGKAAAHLAMHLPRFLPEHWLLRSEEAALVQQVAAGHAGLRGMVPDRAAAKYLEIAARQPAFGHKLFRCKRLSDNLAVFLGVGPKDLLVLATDRPVELALLQFADLLTWSCNGGDVFAVTVRERRRLISAASSGGSDRGSGELTAFRMQNGAAQVVYALVEEYMALLPAKLGV